ncbi:uncharacterized protein EI90DRAFT_3124548 [Cantharellus anzutake]|uniref:uncharacterized protein n=1 Tax=Cantharellus anzutake TaxID=1750568 RepID=UPI0019064BA4|nr:uncharacterized protein EI90DRAFT_3124548 [Cantharellus anzutake]KAF8330135.1 hypothetical protein EI90DRAFT_3124548 [Cantharellus anzutake]
MANTGNHLIEGKAGPSEMSTTPIAGIPVQTVVGSNTPEDVSSEPLGPLEDASPSEPLELVAQVAPSQSLKIEFHHSSGIAPKIAPFEMGTSHFDAKTTPNTNPFSNPWAPFVTKADFEFAELVTGDNCSIHSIETHIKIHMQSPQPAITFTTHKEFEKTLNKAAELLTNVCPIPNLYFSQLM